MSSARPLADKESRQFELAFALHEPAHVQAPGLFRSLDRRARERDRKLHLVYRRGDRVLTFEAPSQLSAVDARVLAVLVGFAGLRGVVPSASAQLDLVNLDAYFFPSFDEKRPLVVRDISVSAIAREMGYSASAAGSRTTVFQSVLRLVDVRVTEQLANGREGAKVPLLTVGWRTTGQDKRLTVALNPWLAGAVLGGQHARIDLAQLRAIGSDAATLLLLRLSALIDPGGQRDIGVTKLLEYVHGVGVSGVYEPAGVAATERGRAARLNKSLGELRMIGWQIDRTTVGKFCVRRPAS